MNLFERVLLLIIRGLEGLMDAYVVHRLRPGGLRFRWLGLGVLGLVLVIAPAWTIVQRSPPPVAPQVDPAVMAFRAAAPQRLSFEGEQAIFRCRGGESPARIAQTVYDYSAIFETDELAERLRSENRAAFSGERCAKDAALTVPEPLLAPLRNEPLRHAADTPIRAMYLRGDNTKPSRVAEEVARMKQIDANGLVFDVKDVIGVVNFRSSAPIVEEYRRHAPPIRNLPKTIRYLHENGIFVIARTALFQDENLAIQRPDLAIRDKNSASGMLLVKGKPLWVDPGRPEVRAYNLQIVQELVQLGVDEIQFDYVRYPAEGDLSGAVYHDVINPVDKTAHLENFLSTAYLLTRGSDVYTSIDIFGIVAWGEEPDLRTTGQRIERLSKWVDIISPMLYPSHFAPGWGGIRNPADEPYRMYEDGVTRFLENSRKGVVIRPWLQAFKWRVSNYNENYIRQQISGSNAAGGVGWMMWNAGNDYDLVYSALRGARLSRGDESEEAESADVSDDRQAARETPVRRRPSS
jgi:hypothetical protein